MSNTIIKVENLGKSYLIGHERQQGYVALRDVIAKNTSVFFKGIQNAFSGKQLMGGQEIEEFWALKDINFEIKQGEAVGIIGRNGAGKSTLLKLLSRITEPTKGRIELNGRVASLLEVGTGFHPELSGRENIFLNGAILGMSRAEIKSKFDEIVDFSGVEKFLDTPVKHYSSGMYVRLAFAVAAHLEPEILVVDEVLAVGDAEFQKKCLGKMTDISQKQGRTVLFVSHNMGAISALCSKAILLNKGSIESFDTTGNVIAKYFSNTSHSSSRFDLTNTKEKYGNAVAELISGNISDNHNTIKEQFYINEEISICMKYRIKKNIDAPVVPNYHFYNANGECIFVVNAPDIKPLKEGIYEASCSIPANFLNAGVHFILLAATTYFQNNFEVNFTYKDALSFEVVDKLHDNPLRYNYAGPIPGAIRPLLHFEIKNIT